jgi:hypothetical protein
MDAHDDQEVEQTLDGLESPASPIMHRDQWLSSSEQLILPDFLGDQTIRAISSHQFHSSHMERNGSSWELGGIALHTVEFTRTLHVFVMFDHFMGRSN